MGARIMRSILTSWAAMGGGVHVPLFSTKFYLSSLVSKSIFSILVFPAPENIRNPAFVPVFPALLSFRSLVPNNFLTIFPCSLKPLREPQDFPNILAATRASQIINVSKHTFSMQGLPANSVLITEHLS